MADGGCGAARRVRTERNAGTMEAISKQAVATSQTSRWPEGFDHQLIFLICAAGLCEVERARGYSAEANSSQEAKRSAGSLERHLATIPSSARVTAGLRREGGSGAAFKIWAQTAPREL